MAHRHPLRRPMTMHLTLHRFVRNRLHLSLAIAFGTLVGIALPDTWRLITRLLVAWNAAVWAYLLALGWMMMRADHNKVRMMAARQDEGAALVLVTLSVAAIISLVAITSQLLALKNVPTDEKALHYGFTVVTLLGSWFLVGTLFCLHYAHLYYSSQAKTPPLRFPDEALSPNYWDFLYFSFTIAVAVQTSDVVVCTRRLRKIVLAQSILTFFFNLVILGLSINIAAGLINN
jgi:uncharacterized membrane protein